MLQQKTGYPQEGEAVFCTVTKIHFHSVFVNLDEYDRKSGMIHISEISPGRIRNISDYVKEGKVIICKVLKINKERGHIDLSLRRVTESQRRQKVEERKQQTIAESIIQSHHKVHKSDKKKLFDTVMKAIAGTYPTLYAAFEDVVEHEADLTKIGLDNKLVGELVPLIKERIKPKQVGIEATLTVKSYDATGNADINTMMKDLVTVSEHMKVQFLGSGRFKFSITSPNYDEAEKIYAKAATVVANHVEGKTIEHELARD